MLDWSAAFDRQCPNIAIQKFSTIGVHGVRASINQLLAPGPIYDGEVQ